MGGPPRYAFGDSQAFAGGGDGPATDHKPIPNASGSLVGGIRRGATGDPGGLNRVPGLTDETSHSQYEEQSDGRTRRNGARNDLNADGQPPSNSEGPNPEQNWEFGNDWENEFTPENQEDEIPDEEITHYNLNDEFEPIDNSPQDVDCIRKSLRDFR
ncbi:hypothetical protein CYLTODRAFT_460736 [Cylindrobasidium torrendii FP15055 ss-10]|uniref:Uncharacterized protein n=1 Tax=Cylindrobasidium torrendii FP15055 ss-10 TaxID=1314674 RepID=A0A0D7ART0_9AGAR|nr:hypothetical protein CYLTODRAFT_460736 [Cylindrobasidium torrendii FP15055 ss-10]